jgi:ABC-type glycerol-3-phosphate transport system substrate-binding protein
MGTSVTLGNSAMIATEFLTRYYAMGGRILHGDAVPRLEDNIAIPALQDYLKQLIFSRQLDEEWWSASVTQFEQGQLAMQISYMNLFNDVAHSPIFPSLGYAPIPGGSPQLGGGSLGVSRYSEKHEQIELFFNWIFSREITEHRVLLGGSSAQQSIYQNQQIIQQYPWFNLLQASACSGIRESSQPDGTPYNLRQAETVIGQGITNAINQIMSVEQAIDSINSRLK